MADWQAGSTAGGVWEQSGPGQPHPGGPQPRGNGGDWPASGPILLLLPTACLVVLAGALLAGLTLDIGGSRSGSAWEARAKVAALSGIFGGGAAPAFGLAGVLLAALVLGRVGDHVPGLGAAVCAAAGWLAVVTAVSIAVDVSLLTGNTESIGGTGYLVGQVLGDIGALTVAGATAALGGLSLRN